MSDALALLRRLEKLLQRFVAAADTADPAQQVGRGRAGRGGAGRAPEVPCSVPLHLFMPTPCLRRLSHTLATMLTHHLPSLPTTTLSQERLDALGGEVEARRERLMRIAEQQVLQVGIWRT